MRNDVTVVEVVNNPDLQKRIGYGVLDVRTESGVGFEDVYRYSYASRPELHPKATAHRLQRVLGRAMTEAEARAAMEEIERYKRAREQQLGRELTFEEAAREWDERHGAEFRKRWFLSQPELSQRRIMPGAHEQGPGALAKTTTVVVPELEPLLESGYGVGDVLLAAARHPLRAMRYVLRVVPKEEKPKYYVKLIARLTGWELSEEEAQEAWQEILQHRQRLQAQGFKDVSLERAAVDYFKRLRLSGLDREAIWSTAKGKLRALAEEREEAKEKAAQ